MEDKLAQKDRDARWTVKYTKAKPREDGSQPAVDLAIPAFGHKNHVSIDRGFGHHLVGALEHALPVIVLGLLIKPRLQHAARHVLIADMSCFTERNTGLSGRGCGCALDTGRSPATRIVDNGAATMKMISRPLEIRSTFSNF